MKIAAHLIIILSLFAAASVGATAKASPRLADEELKQYVEKARQFICLKYEKNTGARGSNAECFLKQVPARADGDTHGFLAYFHRDERRISLSKGLDEVATQINLVHEFTHAYRDQFNHHEETWLDEGLAKFMEYRYSTVWPVSYEDKIRKAPDLRLSNNDQDYQLNGVGYTSSFYLVLYLYNHFGGERLIKNLIESDRSGWDNIITAITCLRRQGYLTIEESLISQSAILRHFALALWLGDPFAAKYALFSLDEHYEPLANMTIQNIDPTSERLQLEPGEARIVFSHRFQATSATEVYALTSRSPLKIETANTSSLAEIFIYIYY